MSQVSAQTPTAAISGVVVDAVTGRPVVGAVVSLSDLDDRLSVFPRMVTDARGRFVFRNLKASKGYYLGARRFGYAYTRYGWSAPGQSLIINDIARIALTEGQWLSTISIPLWRLGAINGRVVDERGEPVIGVPVRVFTTRRVSGQPQLVAGPIATTDDRGVYRIPDLDPGRLRRCRAVGAVDGAQHDGGATDARPVGELATGGIGASRGVSVSSPGIDIDGRHRLVVTNFATPPAPAGEPDARNPAVFHPAARNATEALPIEITYNDNRTGVDFSFGRFRRFECQDAWSRVQDPFRGLLLRLLPVGSERLGFGSEAGTTMVDRDGTFTFLNIPEGHYTILAQSSVMDFTTGSTSIRFPDAPGFPGGGIAVGGFPARRGCRISRAMVSRRRCGGRTAVSVGQRDIDDLVVQMQPVVTVRGRIVPEPGTTVSGRVSLTAEPADGDPTSGQPRGETAPNDPSLAFTIHGLIGGRYLIRPQSINLAVVSMMSAGKDIRDTGVDASAGQDIDDVLVTLTDKVAEIQGTVHGRPGAVTAVIAFPAERQHWTNYGWRPARFRTARAGPAGGFRITGLPAGEYLLVAVTPDQIDAWSDPRFLAAARSGRLV